MSRIHSRRSAGHAVGEFRAEGLEPRQLLTAYTPTTIADYYATPGDLFDLAAPTGIVNVGFGAAVVVLGDVNDDGADDFAVSAPGREASGGNPAIDGVVFIYSGMDRSIIATIDGSTPGFGAVLAPAGDLTGDGATDLFVGTPDHDSAGLYSGATGVNLHALTGDPDAEFGFSFALLDDLDDDNIRDFAVGAPSHDGRGAVVIFSGLEGAFLRRIDGTQDGARFGHALVGYADIDAEDGVGELVVGAPEYDTQVDGDTFADAGGFATVNPVTGVQVSFTQGVHRVERALFGYSLTVDSAGLRVGSPLDGPGEPGEEGGWVDTFVYGFSGSPTWGHLGDIHLETAGARFGLTLRVDTALNRGDFDALYVGTAIGRTYGGNAFGNTTQHEHEISLMLIGDFDADGLDDVLGVYAPDQSSVPIQATSTLEYRAPLTVTGFSPDASYALLSDGRQYFIATRDEFIAASSLPALAAVDPDLTLTAISNDGVLAGVMGRTNVHSPFIVDLANPDARIDVEDVVASVVNPDQLPLTIDNLVPTFVTLHGDIVLTGRADGSSRTRSWLLSGDTLTFLWEGHVTDEAADGTLLGVDIDRDRVVTRSPAGAVTTIEGLADAWTFSPDGSILGRRPNGELVLFDDGVYTRLRAPLSGLGEDVWAPIGVDAAGRAVMHSLVKHEFLTGGGRGGPPRHWVRTYTVDTFFIDTNGVPFLVADRVGESDPENDFGLSMSISDDVFPFAINDYAVPLRQRYVLSPDGRIFTPTHILTPDSAPPRTTAQGPISAAPSPFAPGVVGATSGGMPFALRLGSDGHWYNPAYPEIDMALTTATFLDPKDNQNYVVAFGRQVLPDGRVVNGVIYRQLDNATLVAPIDILSLSEDVIASKLIVFYSPDNRVHIAGLNHAGGLVMFYQNGARFPDGSWAWAADNISANHLFPQDIENPSWRDADGGLTAYVTSWGGLNVAGLTTSGAIEVVWWAPGMQFWSKDNLSDIAGLPELRGSITSYVTAWDGLNVAATDEDGNLHVTWWVPGFGTEWRKSAMTDEFDGRTLEGITSYVTPWGGLNIAGVDVVTGRPAVYWWAPATDVWVSELIGVAGGTEAGPWPTSGSGLTAVVRGSELNLLGVADEGDVVRLSWNPGDGGTWTLDNLTELAHA